MCQSVISAINFTGGGSLSAGVLQIAGGVALDATLRFVEDQNGTDSALQVSTTDVASKNGSNFGYFNGIGLRHDAVDYVYLRNNYGVRMQAYNGGSTYFDGYADRILLGTGTHTQNGYLSVKGAGGNIQSWRSSANVEVASMGSGGALILSSDLTLTGNIVRTSRGRINWYGTDGVMTLTNSSETNFTRLNFGGIGASNPAIEVSGSTLATKYADGATGYCGFAAGEGTRKGISVIKGGSNTPYVGLFGVTEIAQPTTAIGDATYVSGGGGTNMKTDDTFNGYTLPQIVKALTDIGILG